MAFSLSHYRKEYKQEVQDELDQAEKKRQKFQVWMQPMVERVLDLLLDDDGKPVYARCGWFRTNPNELGGYRFVINERHFSVVIEILPDKEHEFRVSVCKTAKYPQATKRGEFVEDGSAINAGSGAEDHYLDLDPSTSNETDELDEEFLRDVARLCEE